MLQDLGLFTGALLDALIGPNLFVPGEPFLIAAGYQLQQGLLGGVIAVLLGGFIGDQLSFMIGRRLGKPAQNRLTKWQPKTRRPIARCRRLMATKGNYVLMFARLLGPVAWVVPFMAGTARVEWARFTLFSTVGLVLGVGQFVMWGYLLSYGVDNFPYIGQATTFVVEHKVSLLAVLFSLVFYVIGRRLKWRFMFTKFSALFLVSMLYVNYAHFFFYSDDVVTQQPVTKATNEISPTQIDYKVYPGRSSVFDAQAVNVVYLGESPRDLMINLGWIENKTFSRNDLEFSDYVKLMRDNTPPVSDLFWNDIPQEMAFQLPGNLIKRSHIRWWHAGVDIETKKPLWIGALSYDNGLELTPYSGILTVLHSIDPDVDAERDKLADQITDTLPNKQVELKMLKDPIAIDGEHDYYTDGNVLVIHAV